MTTEEYARHLARGMQQRPEPTDEEKIEHFKGMVGMNPQEQVEHFERKARNEAFFDFIHRMFGKP